MQFLFFSNVQVLWAGIGDTTRAWGAVWPNKRILLRKERGKELNIEKGATSVMGCRGMLVDKERFLGNKTKLSRVQTQ